MAAGQHKKQKYSMNPLYITVAHVSSLDLIDQNLKNFINSGYNHLHNFMCGGLTVQDSPNL
jgi:hypothetical protein